MNALYPYQQRVLEQVLAGHNIIVQAPTGAGKTLSALYPFFHNLDRFSEDPYNPASSLPLTCRYAVPMRVLAAQFKREYADLFETMDKSRATRMLRRYKEKLNVALPAIQTGEEAEDPAFESPLTFCTIDQLLASALGTPYSLSPRMANLNVGAVAGSYLILDEFHLYPLDHGSGARTTALALLRLLKGVCRFIVMTATFSSDLLDQLAMLLDATVVRVNAQEELDAIMRGRTRSIRTCEHSMTAETILSVHNKAHAREAGASLVICNTVARAQQMYLDLNAALEQRGERESVRLELLHSRFTPEHRRAKSERLERWLGKDAWKAGRFQGQHTIVVGTQVVEVGLNISANILHTELAPANSLIQRAGRCARFVAQHGEVIVYPLPPNEKGIVSYRPYDEPLCTATWRYLNDTADRGSAIAFSFTEEQKLINAVHSAEDIAMLASFREREDQIQRAIMEALNTHEYGSTSTLIRNVTSISVVVHSAPERAITTNPFTWEHFQLHPTTLEGAWQRLNARRDSAGAEWVLKELQPGGDALESSEDDNDRESVYTWAIVTDPTQIKLASRLVLPPELATYDENVGFRLLLADGVTSTLWMSKPVDAKPASRGRAQQKLGRQGSYVEHITGLMRAYDWSLRRELAWIATQLEDGLRLPPEHVDLAVRLAIACHDIGKLGTDWQHWAHEWQALLITRYGEQYSVQPGREWLAKTDRRHWREERELRQALKACRPTHACASVLASQLDIAGQVMRGLSAEQREAGAALVRAILSAIARHHTPTATEYDTVQWDPAARSPIREALAACRLSADHVTLTLDTCPRGKLRDQWLLPASSDSRQAVLTTWLGFVLVRVLRLCDQRAERDW